MLENVGNILKDYHEEHSLDLSSSDYPPVRTSLLHPYIEARGVVDRIGIYEADIETKHIVALVQKFQGETGPYSGTLDLAKIYYAKNHNYCWRRFGVCKEMFHCMIDRTMADRVATTKSLTTLLELLAADTTALTGDFAPLNREQEAELLALETLFPVEFRTDYLEKSADEDTIKAFAKQFCIPEEYARLACRPTYNQAVIRIRGRLEDLK